MSPEGLDGSVSGVRLDKDPTCDGTVLLVRYIFIERFFRIVNVYLFSTQLHFFLLMILGLFQAVNDHTIVSSGSDRSHFCQVGIGVGAAGAGGDLASSGKVDEARD